MIATPRPIVYISPYYEPEVHSGANRRFDELIRRFARDYGTHFTLIVTEGKAPSWYTGNLIEVHYNFNHASKIRAVREIGEALEKLPPSIVICESVPIPLHALRRHVHFQVAYDFRYFTGDSKSLLYRMAFSHYLKSQWQHSEYMVTSSDFSISELVKYVDYNPARIVKSFFGIDESILALRATPLPEKEYDVIYVGHFEKRKNHEPLIRALAHMGTNPRVLFCGRDNGMQKLLQDLCRELGLTQVTFTHGKTDTELWDLYRKSRVFAYPSIYEGFGIPLIEALALNIPVACSDIPVFHEVGGSFPTFFNPHDPEDIAKTLTNLLANPPSYDEAAIRTHLAQFFWENIYTRFVEDVTARAASRD